MVDGPFDDKAVIRHPETTRAATAENAAAIIAGLTIPLLLQRNAEQFGELPALSTLTEPQTTLTWAEVRDRVAATARGLAELGLQPGGRLLIMAGGRPEHWLVDLAAVHLGAVPGTAYATLSTEQCGYLGRHSQAQILVLEGAEQLARWTPVLDDLPELRAVLIIDESALPSGDPRFQSLAEITRVGAQLHRSDPSVFETTWSQVRPDQPVTLLYTSGTTGDPKGVLLSHRNVLYQAAASELLIPLPAHSPSVAYLPLAHIAERMLGIYQPIYRAGHVHICPDPATLTSALRLVRPASFFGVPRVWEKLVAGLQSYLATAEEQQQQAFRSASALMLQAYQVREQRRPVPAELAATVAEADRLVLRPIRATLGLDNLRWPGSGAAPIPVEVLLFLAGLGIDVLEVWGMTETTGTVTINTPERFRTGSVGQPHLGTEIRLAEDGEILVRSPLVALGYLGSDGGIEPITDDGGWLATGDIGTLDQDGFLTITDRKKELIITAGGKNISPAQIENSLRSHPLIGQAVAIGDRRPYVTALIALDGEIAPAWAQAHQLDPVAGSTPAFLAAHPAVLAEIQAAVDLANSRLARPEQIKRFRILADPWTPETGELTPTLKLRRRVILERHHRTIDEMYD